MNTSQPTKRQIVLARKAAQLITQIKEGEPVMDEVILKAPATRQELMCNLHAYPDNIFHRWMNIESIQFERLGGDPDNNYVNEDTDALHDQAGEFASDLIAQEWEKIRDVKVYSVSSKPYRVGLVNGKYGYGDSSWDALVNAVGERKADKIASQIRRVTSNGTILAYNGVIIGQLDKIVSIV